jgi:hypothetical protein
LHLGVNFVNQAGDLAAIFLDRLQKEEPQRIGDNSILVAILMLLRDYRQTRCKLIIEF